ncbi:MAG: RAMP superfamily CRISPR-associated protein [Thiomicrospira sp.]
MKSNNLILNLTLLEPLVISQSNATEGSHQSLDYIPGATILGAIAAQYYVALKQQGLAWDMFHSGKVRFHNAYPLVDNAPSMPMPLSLHYDKLGDKEAPINYLHKTYSPDERKTAQQLTQVIQGKQHRKGYIAPNSGNQAWFIEPEKTLQMRTAINPKKGTAQEGQLYGYQLLKANTRYQACISSDEPHLIALLSELLVKQNQLLIGRSRSAQYGKVQLQVQTASDNQPIKPIIKINDKDHLVLWLASDMAIYNQYGQPTLAPTLQEMGLDVSGEFNSAKSFVRTRQYAPYNGYRRSYDLERQVLSQGSILSYELKSELSDADWQKMQQGLGAYTENGLGQLVLNTHFNLLKLDELQLKKPEADQQANSASAKTTDLIEYLQQKAEERAIQGQNAEQIDKLLKELHQLYQSARNYNGLMPGQPFGPGKSQWGAVRTYATQAKDRDALTSALFHGSSAFIKDTDKEKDKDWCVSTGKETYKNWLQDKVKNHDPVIIRGLAFKVTQDKTLLNLMEGK